MTTDKIQNLIKISKDYIEAAKRKKVNFNEILSGLYNDPSHFIYEILQNADDAHATEITFKLSEDKLEIIHNGKDFTFDDVESITGIGLSTKREDINTIGKFGVGFKSVFAVTKTPIIHSGNYHFKIEEFVIPTIINDDHSLNETKIILPLNHPSRGKDDVYQLVSKKLESIGLKTLLFLKKIEKVKWHTINKSGHYYKTIVEVENANKVTVISNVGNSKEFEKYLVFGRPIKIEGNDLTVEIAYRIGKDDNEEDIIIKEKNSKLIVFFPTEKVTYLNFLIQGPYKTTPNRENIPLNDEQNIYIIDETANLVADSISIIKELGFLNVSFLEVLPINQDYLDEIIYSTIYERVKEKLLSDEAFLPTSRINFTTASNALLADGKELPEFLSNNDIIILFNKQDWLDTNITDYRTRELRKYFIHKLNIKEVDFKEFVVNISTEFIERKSDKWIVDFYSRLSDQRALWPKSSYYGRNVGILNKPIIRLSDNSHIEPLDLNNKIQVYLPSETKSQYKTVKKILTENENSLKFLTELGLTEPDIFAEIKEFIIPKYQNAEPDIYFNEYLEDFTKLLNAYMKDSSDKKSDLIADLKNLFIIYSSNLFSGENQIKRPNEVYIMSDDLSEYFKKYESIFFVSNELTQIFKNKKEVINEFLIAIGCENKPRRIEFKGDLTWEEKENLRSNSGYSYSRDIYIKDYDYEGLDDFIKNINPSRSILLFKFLLSSLNDLDYWEKSNFFKGEYCWTPRSRNRYEKFDSKFLKTLMNTDWLFDANGCQAKPSLISISELADDYPKDEESIRYFVDLLGFKLDEIRKIEEKTGGKFLSKEEYEDYLKLKEEQNKQENIEESEEDDLWNPEVEPELIETVVEEIEPELIETPDRGGQRPHEKDTEGHKGEPTTVESDEPRKEISRNKILKIGNWGECRVFKHLQEKYANNSEIEIIWQNENGDVGKGFDFSILSNDEEIEYIEVKTKIDDKPQFIEITGTQWEFARKLYNINEGDKYKIYIVSNAGTDHDKIGRIKNPVKLWKEGRLYAHPIHFKL